METLIDSAPARWTVAECPFLVEYIPRVLDDIRLAVVDAFFSLPRGGAEIGGILLGRQDKCGILITDSLPLDCEHAFGPSFTLSKTDLTRLAEMLAAAAKNPALKPVGWYHSHTRSEVFLSDADREIHQRFFPEPWQVALVLKPHTFQPTRAGFFFQDKGGAIHGTASYQEFVLEPLPMRAAPPPSTASEAPALAPVPTPVPAARSRTNSQSGPVIDVAPMAEVEPAGPSKPVSPEPVDQPAPCEVPPPAFLAVEPPRSSRRWIGFAAAVLGVGLATGAYQTRDGWLPRVNGWFHRPAPDAQASIGLNTLDRDGQLQISWNGEAPEIRQASGGTLLITEGGAAARNIGLDAAHLRSGSFTFVRQGEQVDVTLLVHRQGGQKLMRTATFLGQLPRRAGDSNPRQDRDDLARQVAGLKVDLANQVARNKVLEKALADLREAFLRDALQKRLENQTPPDPGK